MNEYYIGVDLGGTNIVAAVIDENQNICSKMACKTNVVSGPKQIVDDICTLISCVVQKASCTFAEIGWIGIGTPGIANPNTGVVDFAGGNLPFDHFPLGKAVEKRILLPTWICNDANAAALGEWICGQHQSCSSLALVTLGTGIGCGLILQHTLYSGINFAAGELGHMVIKPDGIPCHCGRNGCFEMYASASGLIRMTKSYMKENPESFLWTLCRGNLDLVTGKTAFDGFRAGDATSSFIVKEYIMWLALGLTNLINLLQPDVICIGGGISNEGEVLLQLVKEEIGKQEYARNCLHRTQLKIASLKNDAGLIGAALFPRFVE